MIAWIVLWMAAMMTVIVAVGRGLLAGDGQGSPLFLLIWLAAAGFGLYQGIKALRRMLLRQERAPHMPRAPLERRHRGLTAPPWL
jgi:hypothetical protein